MNQLSLGKLTKSVDLADFNPCDRSSVNFRLSNNTFLHKSTIDMKKYQSMWHRSMLSCLMLFGIFLMPSLVSAQSNNTMPRDSVMEEVQGLSKAHIDFIHSAYDRLSNEQINKFLDMAQQVRLQNQYGEAISQLKLVATTEEVENLYAALSEDSILALLNKYAIKID